MSDTLTPCDDTTEPWTSEDLSPLTQAEVDEILAEVQAELANAEVDEPQKPDEELHRDLIASWLPRIFQNLPRRPTFEAPNAEAKERDWLGRFIGHTGFPKNLATWEHLGFFMRCKVNVDPTRGGFLPLPDTRSLSCLRRLADVCGLSDLQLQLLAFTFLLKSEDGLQFLEASLQKLRRAEVIRLVAAALGCTPHALEQEIRPSGPLVRAGLLFVWPGASWADWLELASGLLDGLHLAPDDPAELLRGIVDRAPAATLSLDAFDHLESPVGLAVEHLQQSRAAGAAGVNILLYGPPGTGKTELARTLAEAVGLRLFQVSTIDLVGEPRSAAARLRALVTAQQLLRGSEDSLVLFDESESSLATAGLFRDPALNGMKAWLNTNFEQNEVPVIWVANDIDTLDPAYLRRFDVVIEVPVPPASTRRRILTEVLGDLQIHQDTLERLAGCEVLAPAVVSRAVEVVRRTAGRRERSLDEAALLGLLDQSLRAMGHRLGLSPKRAVGF